MDVTMLRLIAVFLARAGAVGTAAMILYKAAYRRVDLRLVPASAVPRVRWWATHASRVLSASLALAFVGLVLLGVTGFVD